ncbi:MAG: NAD-glutamate dehydrogenase [Henriciella sp.]|nr:NAD-glutamate dehydrogenase [Henriciella sp.]
MTDTIRSNPESSKTDPLQSCIAQMLAEAPSDTRKIIPTGKIEALAQSMWEWFQSTDDVSVRLRTAESVGADILGHFILEAVGPDRPFLVDSLLGACSDLGIEVLTLFHPIVELDDGPHSLIQIHLPDLTAQQQKDLLQEAKATLSDVIDATGDYGAMRQRMAEEIARLEANTHVTSRYKDEAVEFLKWLGQERFVFLGARSYTFQTGEDGAVLPEEPDTVEGSNLGLLRDDARNVLNRGAEPLLLTEEIGAFLAEPESLILAKATLFSRVHRRVNCDYVGVKHYGENGQVIGETRFLGLYTAEAYNESVRNIPLLRRRMERVLELLEVLPGSHNEKAISNIIEGWPRDELIQTKSEHLAPIMQGVLDLVARPRVRVFSRPDRFNRFVSTVVFVPREAYDTDLRRHISIAIEDAWGGRMTAFQPSFDGATMVRVLFQTALPTAGPRPDPAALEAKIAKLARRWNDRFADALAESQMDAEARAVAGYFVGAFNAGYREAFSPEEAMTDVAMLASLNPDHPICLRAYRRDSDGPGRIRAKIYSREGAIALSDCVPIFERMGLFVSFETGYPVTPSQKPVADAPDEYWVHSLSMKRSDRADIDLLQISEAFESAFVAVWSGQAENDGFNALVFNAGLNWRHAALCRALCAYRHQTGLDPARSTQIAALNAHPKLTKQLVALFDARFSPDLEEARDEACQSRREAIDEALKAVPSLDHDRVIRRLADLIMAIQRTNFYQSTVSGAPRPFISFKIASRELEDLPAPKPYREIFIDSPMVEGVHCRFGPVARGGLRWSDRRDDFRTEILGLVKAQQVKNAVIVPVGSKGGFFPKQLPQGGSREAVRDAGVEAYKTFITSLLDLTDNLIDGSVHHPERTVIHDGDDPYLVVAADKGTATFSDIANEISMAQGFWLGDAFASGGSAGYDHKKMGITARGAWEAVKRHFREIGKDIQSEPFTVIGCGDMSGDVFGNGMLLSKQIRLQAAFNHMHIFIDPNPQDPETLWKERQRMFDLPRSSWMDYDASLISEGGGIFARTAKAIELSPEIKALTGLSADSVTPDELIHALLKSECELLWFGGIGTYVKASDETDTDAGDRANDSVRVDGSQLKAKVIGEGANLGLTQAGRIEAALNGVRLNTDAIDNSAGVDSSDHEVNIKILCTEAIRRGDLPSGERNVLLASMTDDVATHVLAHNYAQTNALSLAEMSAQRDHDAFERLMLRLEQRGVLDRAVEGLPNSAQMAQFKQDGRTLTRPEIAVLMAWTKIVLFDDLVASDIPDDPYFHQTLEHYFPEALRSYESTMQAHRLKREVISTVLANRIIDAAGPIFMLRLREQTGAPNAEIVAAFEIASALMGMRDLQQQINTLDNQAPAQRQLAMQAMMARALASLTHGVLGVGTGLPVADRIAALSDCADTLSATDLDQLPTYLRGLQQRRIRQNAKDGVPTDLVTSVAQTMLIAGAPVLSHLVARAQTPPSQTAETYRNVGDALSLDRLRAAADLALNDMPYWDRLATRGLIRELEQLQSDAAQMALAMESPKAWLTQHRGDIRNLVSEIKTFTGSKPSFAQFALATDAVRKFMQNATDV